MFKRLFFPIFLLFAAICQAQNSDCFFHTVERGQTVYSLAKMYNVTVDDIYRLNPDSRTMIRDGQQLKIPQQSGSYIFHTIQPQETLYGVSKRYDMKGEDIVAVNPGLSVATFQIGKIIRIPVNRVTTPVQGGNETLNSNKTNSLLYQTQPVRAISPVKIALILPFDAKGKKDSRMVEYYEGFLLALKELKSRGISVNLQVYDSGTGADKLAAILKKDEMQNIHLIIGGIGDQIQEISRFSADRNIPYVIPFTSESDEPFYNPRVYQINTPQSYLYAKASLAFTNTYRDGNILIVTGENNNKIEFVNALKADLQAKKIPCKTITTAALTDENLAQQLSILQRNIFVPADDSRQFIEQVMNPLKVFAEQNPEYFVSLFGYSRWQIHAQQALANDFFRLNTSFFSGFYTNSVNEDVQTFYKTFYKWYGRTVANSVPHYGILGYDTGMFFILALDRFGASFDKNIDSFKYDGIQTCFHFERVNNWSGFVNTGLYFVNYNSDASVTKAVIN
jgi:LysM repeat protein